MSSEGKVSFISSLKWRLTLSFISVFAVLLSCTLLAVYFWLRIEIYYAIDNSILHELEEAEMAYKRGGLNLLKDQIDSEASELGYHEVFYRVLDVDNNQQMSTDMSSWGNVPVSWNVLENITKSRHAGETIWLSKSQKYIRIVSRPLDNKYIIQSGIYIKDQLNELAKYRKLLPLVGFFVLFLALVTGFWIVTVLVKRINKVTHLVAEVSSTNLSERLPIEVTNDEIDILTMQFNLMLDRIENLVNEVNQISNDVAHDLKSPLTRIRLSVENALDNNQTSESFKLLENTLNECDSMMHMINSLLDISRIQTGSLIVEHENINLTEVVAEALDLFEPIAESKEIIITQDLEERVFVNGSIDQLQRLIANLLDNAIKFTDKSGLINLKLEKQANQAIFTCEDNGIGISESDIRNIFKNFFRCEESRVTSGHGLGLALCSSIVRAHGGKIEVASKLGTGSAFRVILPLANQREVSNE